MKSKNILLILLISISCMFLFVGCGNKKLTDQEYDKKITEFNTIFDSMSKDFYKQCTKSLDGEKTDTNLYSLYKEDVNKLIDIFGKYNEKLVPDDKKDDLKQRQRIAIVMLIIEGDTMENTVLKTEECNEFNTYAEKRFTELGTLDSQKASAFKSTKPNLELLDKTDIYENGISYITGHIINNSDKAYSIVTVNINIYDKNGVLLGNSEDTAYNLNQNETWKFKAMVTQKDFGQYKITSIQGN